MTLDPRLTLGEPLVSLLTFVSPLKCYCLAKSSHNKQDFISSSLGALLQRPRFAKPCSDSRIRERARRALMCGAYLGGLFRAVQLGQKSI